MPKVRVHPSKGLYQDAGEGQQWEASAASSISGTKGFKRVVKFAQVELGLDNAADIDSGIDIPAYAQVEWVALKSITAPTDAASSDLSAYGVSGFKFSNDVVTMSSAISMLTAGLRGFVNFAATTANAAQDVDAQEQAITHTSDSNFVLIAAETGADNSADTTGTIEVVVSYLLPLF